LKDSASSSRRAVQNFSDFSIEYFDQTVSADLSPVYDRFLKYVRPKGRILDIGCGSGRDLKALHDRGFEAVGIDASLSLAKLAAEFSGVTCLPMRFEDLQFEHPFDAAWACASLVHIPKGKLVSVLRRLHKTLIGGGILFVSVKVGKGEHLLRDGRFFAYYTRGEFEQFLTKAGFAIDQSWISKDYLRPTQKIRWLNIIAHRANSAKTLGRLQQLKKMKRYADQNGHSR
jgi:2-polyprenyl-3-methyl-5-hydroxy-6-metoxy-1,4-benzoquinol methylase